MPLPVISIAQMREWEKATWAAGQTELNVIRGVGKAVAHRALQLTRAGDRILLLAGRGNNGQDALASVESLADRLTDVVEVKDPATDIDALHTALSRKPNLIVDGLFGIGLNRPLSPPWVAFIEQINQAKALVLSIDVPSGLNADTGESFGAVVLADVTLTVGAPKSGLLKAAAANLVGRLEVTPDVGLLPCPCSSRTWWPLEQDFIGFPPVRRVSTHKGSYGHLAILAGSLGFHGAAVLAARGAQRAQPGLITVLTSEEAYAPVASQLQAVMVAPWRGTPLTGGPWTACLIGPGLAAQGCRKTLETAIAELWKNAAFPVVADASALDWLPPGETRNSACRVLTPHPGEAARLLGCPVTAVQEDRFNAVRRLSEKFGNAWVVLKGHQTVIGKHSGDIHVNSSGNPWLAQGGSGDALAGFLAGWLAQPSLRDETLKTLRYAIWQHGATADHLQTTRPGWTIEDLADHLGRIAPQP
jgi:NAD(P)H-hydrate epimerase